jgi:hypothetical protein
MGIVGIDLEMRPEQREKWRREINDEILPSLFIETEMTVMETIMQLRGLYRGLFHILANVVFSDQERSKFPEKKVSFRSL